MNERPGARNLLTDVAGLRVGHGADVGTKSGVSVVICDRPATAGVAILGGSPGTRETELLAPHNLVENVDALVLAGGSAFGLDAASGVQAALRERGAGFEVRGHRVPIVPAAILFDLDNGGRKDWGRYPPYRELGYEAAMQAGKDFAIGTAGAGTGALTAGLKGGIGSASWRLSNGVTVGALAAVNPRGSVTIGRSNHFWAAPMEWADEFGGRGMPDPLPGDAGRVLAKTGGQEAGANTTLAVVATDARLDKPAAQRLAIAGQDGLARAIWPSHTLVDGDLVFALATGHVPIELKIEDMIALHAAVAATAARAIARAVFHATPAPGDIFPTWAQRAGLA